MMPIRDIIGQRFGRLVAKRRDANGSWECACDCGNVSMVWLKHLGSGGTRSCGCLSAEIMAGNTYGLRHGHASRLTPEYMAWRNIKSRCTNESTPGFHLYGGRGISFCDRWHVFENFLEDMGERPGPGHSIDRIDNSLGYSPDNCAWRDKKTQSRNTRSNRLVSFGGKTMPIASWADEVGINRHAIGRRIAAGWSVLDALTVPVSSSNTRRSK